MATNNLDLQDTFITSAFLESEEACMGSVNSFHKCFPNGIYLNKKSVEIWSKFVWSGGFGNVFPSQNKKYSIFMLSIVYLLDFLRVGEKIVNEIISTYYYFPFRKRYVNRVCKILNLK